MDITNLFVTVAIIVAVLLVFASYQAFQQVKLNAKQQEHLSKIVSKFLPDSPDGGIRVIGREGMLVDELWDQVCDDRFFAGNVYNTPLAATISQCSVRYHCYTAWDRAVGGADKR